MKNVFLMKNFWFWLFDVLFHLSIHSFTFSVYLFFLVCGLDFIYKLVDSKFRFSITLVILISAIIILQDYFIKAALNLLKQILKFRYLKCFKVIYVLHFINGSTNFLLAFFYIWKHFSLIWKWKTFKFVMVCILWILKFSSIWNF